MKLPHPISALWVAALALTGCDRQKAPPLAAAPPEVIVTTVERRDVPIVREWIGSLDGSANVEVRARVQGYLQQVAFKEGTIVKTNDLLLRIDPRPLEVAVAQSQAELAKAMAGQKKTEIDEQRQQQLFSRKVNSQQDLDNAVQAHLAANAEVEADRAAVQQTELNLSYATITSPIDGIVGRTDFTVGDYVAVGGAGTPVTTVSTVDPIKLVFPVSEKDYLQVGERLAALLAMPLGQRPATADLIRADGKLHPHKGQFLAADREVDEKTGTIRISAIFPNPGNLLRPGQYARIRLQVAERAGAILVPQRAVQELQGKNFVWVVDEGNKVTQRSVTVGPRQGSDWLIEEGLKPGERVVVEGLQKVRQGAPVQPSTAAPMAAAGAAADNTLQE